MSPQRRRRRGNQPTRCSDCGLQVLWLSWRGRRRPFEPAPIDGRTNTGPPAYPVESGRAWRVDYLVQDLIVRRETTKAEAEREAYDMPWHVPHTCPPATPDSADHAASEPEEDHA